jgi:hypothetical protein
VIGVLVLALLVAGLAWRLADPGDDTGKGSTATSEAGAPEAEPTRERSRRPGPSATRTSASPSPSPPPSPSPEPAQSVEVAVSGSHTEHHGPCPAPEGQRPSLTASFTVGRAPAEVRYRWVTDLADGVLDEGWKTLAFAQGTTSREQSVPLALDGLEGAVEGSVHVEVDRPVEASSDPVSVAVVCETPEEPGPTGGTEGED